MTDRPILFSAPMVRALLAGTKTQTRRPLNPQPSSDVHSLSLTGQNVSTNAPVYETKDRHGGFVNGMKIGAHSATPILIPRFGVGDRLWVRESWRTDPYFDACAPRDIGAGRPLRPEADGDANEKLPSMLWGKLRPGMFMPRWASRLTLIVTEVRVERLQNISEEDALAEGIVRCGRFFGVAEADWDSASTISAADAYGNLWEEINGPRSWDANPWVVAVTFTVHKRNIDAAE